MIDLPKHSASGKPKISYSQISSWHDKQFFNQITGPEGKMKSVPGNIGYILKYFLDYQFPPSEMEIYAPFGTRIETALTTKDYSGFAQDEIETLKKVEVIGHFQHKIELDFGEFVLEGYVDDCNVETAEGPEHPLYLDQISDFKTASETSKKRYYSSDYIQLQVYSLDKWMRSGKLPGKVQVNIIERVGSHKNLPLKVGSNVWVVPLNITEDKLMLAKNKVITTVNQISDCYKVFKAINGYT